MKTWKMITPILLIAALFTYFTVRKIFDHTNSIKVLNFPEKNICYLVSPEYEVKLTPEGFNYKGGKNIGEVTFYQGEIDPTFNKRKLGEFLAGYKKIKNYRLSQFELGDGQIAFEKFQFIKSRPANLQPFQKDCNQLLKMHGQLILE